MQKLNLVYNQVYQKGQSQISRNVNYASHKGVKLQPMLDVDYTSFVNYIRKDLEPTT